MPNDRFCSFDVRSIYRITFGNCPHQSVNQKTDSNFTENAYFLWKTSSHRFRFDFIQIHTAPFAMCPHLLACIFYEIFLIKTGLIITTPIHWSTQRMQWWCFVLKRQYIDPIQSCAMWGTNTSAPSSQWHSQQCLKNNVMELTLPVDKKTIHSKRTVLNRWATTMLDNSLTQQFLSN